MYTGKESLPSSHLFYLTSSLPFYMFPCLATLHPPRHTTVHHNPSRHHTSHHITLTTPHTHFTPPRLHYDATLPRDYTTISHTVHTHTLHGHSRKNVGFCGSVCVSRSSRLLRSQSRSSSATASVCTPASIICTHGTCRESRFILAYGGNSARAKQLCYKDDFNTMVPLMKIEGANRQCLN